MSVEGFVYACVSYRDLVLAEYQAEGSVNIKPTLASLMPRREFKDTTQGFKSENHNWLIYSDQSRFTAVIVCEKTVDLHVAEIAMEELRSRFLAYYGSSYRSAKNVNEFNNTFQPCIHQIFISCHKEDIQNLHAIRRNQEIALSLMEQNVEEVVQREQDVRALERKTANIAQSAKEFERESQKVKCCACWFKYKVRIFIGIVAVFIIALVVILALI